MSIEKKQQLKIVVMSGKGGVGKSTVAVNLAYAFALEGYKTGLIDADVHGPSQAKLTNTQGLRVHSNDNQKLEPIQVLSHLSVLSIAHLLEHPDQPIIWRGPMKANFIHQMIEDTEWEGYDVLISDCPPGTGDEVLSVVQILKPDAAVIVSTPQELALLDVRKSISFAFDLNISNIVLIENMGVMLCPSCGAETHLFKGNALDKASADFDIPIISRLPFNQEILLSGETGVPVAADSTNTYYRDLFLKAVHYLIDKTKKGGE